MESKSVIDKLVVGFKKAATELEEFQLQFALGKSEAKEKYEEVKKKFNHTLHEAELKMDNAKEYAEKLKTKFDGLRVQLALGKAETKEAFEEQRKKINLKIHDIEVMIKTNPTLIKMYESLTEQFEKLKIQLEILSINYNLAVKNSSDSIEKRRAEMDKIIERLQSDLAKHYTKEPEPTKWEHFQKEMGEAYKHLKTAFTK